MLAKYCHYFAYWSGNPLHTYPRFLRRVTVPKSLPYPGIFGVRQIEHEKQSAHQIAPLFSIKPICAIAVTAFAMISNENSNFRSIC